MIRVKRIIISLILIITTLTSLYAQDTKSRDTLTVTPSLSYQHIFYSVQDYTDKDGFGPGLGLSYDHFFNPKTSVGAAVSIEHFIFKDFYHYTDLKAQATAKIRLFKFNSDSEDVGLFITLGAGCDFVFRNDADFGAYPLVNLGLEAVILNERDVDAVIKTEVGLTRQNGSMVLQANIGAGIRFDLRETSK